MYVLFFKDNQVLAIYKKEANRTYHTQFEKEEIDTEENLIQRIKEIDENFEYKTEAERQAEMEERNKPKTPQWNK